MGKKAYHIVSLYLGGIILMILTLLPHHHVHEEMCLYHLNDNSPHHCENHSEKGSSDQGMGAHFCIQDQLIIIPANNPQLIVRKFNLNSFTQSFGNFIAVCNYQGVSFYPPSGKLYSERRDKPDIIIIVTGQPGLRAPPVA